MTGTYTEMKVRDHVVGIERLEKLRWRVTVDGRRCFGRRAGRVGYFGAVLDFGIGRE